jgi:hypothetical protein
MGNKRQAIWAPEQNAKPELKIELDGQFGIALV